MDTITRFRTGKLELNVTPSWWCTHEGGPRSVRDPGSGARMGEAMVQAISAFPVQEVRASRTELRLLVVVPDDVTLEVIEQKAAALVERLNAL